MPDKVLEWNCNAQDSNLRLSIQEIASRRGTMSAYDPACVKTHRLL
jgi:hypothetical protein